MARAPETGFYFEPMAERLVVVVEGSPFPTDDHWAWVGDPIEMSPELARLECANRWPGVDPDGLQVEFDLDFERAVEEPARSEENQDSADTIGAAIVRAAKKAD
jgi:hypothetical protein